MINSRSSKAVLCGECIYFDRTPHHQEVLPQFDGICRLMVGMGKGGKLDQYATDSRAICNDAAHHHAWLMVREDFGCVQGREGPNE